MEKWKLDDNIALGESNLVERLYQEYLFPVGGLSLDTHEPGLLPSLNFFWSQYYCPRGGFLGQVSSRLSLLPHS